MPGRSTLHHTPSRAAAEVFDLCAIQCNAFALTGSVIQKRETIRHPLHYSGSGGNRLGPLNHYRHLAILLNLEMMYQDWKLFLKTTIAYWHPITPDTTELDCVCMCACKCVLMPTKLTFTKRNLTQHLGRGGKSPGASPADTQSSITTCGNKC